MKFIRVIVFALCIAAPVSAVRAGDLSFTGGDIAIFSVPQEQVQLRALLDESEAAITDVLDSLGRFVPVENNRFQKALPRKETYSLDDFRVAAEDLEVSLYIVLSIYRSGDEFTGEMKIVPVNPLFRGMEKNIIVKSRVMPNIPLKLAREVVLAHRAAPIRARITDRKGENLVISAGQWHGLSAGRYDSSESGPVEVLQAGRYSSLVRAPGAGADSEYVILPLFPDTEKQLHRLEERMEKNILYRYGLGNTLLKGTDPERKYIEGTCVINPGANVCVPGYGSFLATEYLGFKNAKPHLPGVILSSTLILNHFLLTEFMTGFRSNFFPWVRDGDKGRSMQVLHIFLWSSLPFTLTISYFDQLAWQFEKTEHLPAFFQYRDEAALAFSLLFPGGGLMYKGHRLMGWGYYAVEMSLAGLAAWEYRGGTRFVTALSVLGAVKVLEMVHAWAAGTAYGFYRSEEKPGVVVPSFSLNSVPGGGSETVYRVSLSARFD